MGAGWTRWFREGGDIAEELLLSIHGHDWTCITARPGAAFWRGGQMIFLPKHDEEVYFHMGVWPATESELFVGPEAVAANLGVRGAIIGGRSRTTYTKLRPPLTKALADAGPDWHGIGWHDPGPVMDIQRDDTASGGYSVRVCVHCHRSDGVLVAMMEGSEICTRCGRDQVIPCLVPRFAGMITNLKDRKE